MRLYICAYCKEYGHYINKCKHPNINILLNNIKQYAIIHFYCMIKHNFKALVERFACGKQELYMLAVQDRLEKKYIRA